MKIMDKWKRTRISGSQRGFTLFEAVVVLVLMGIVSVVIISRATLAVDSTVVAEAEALKSQLRYAQRRAMSTGDAWGINISGNSYSMFYNDGTLTTVAMPGYGETSRDLGTLGITLSGAPLDGNFSFDSWGRPCSGSTGTSALTSNRTLTVSKGSRSETITITKNTGFIP